MNSTTPRGIALIASLITGGVVFFSVLFSSFAVSGKWNLFFPLVTASVSVVISFLVVFYLVDRFIYARVKVIYKTIYNQKLNKETKEKIQSSPDMIGDVNDEVIEWAKDKDQQIEKLKEQENFRREFLGNLAHELKTPIFSIQGYILTLLDGGLDDPSINRNFLQRAANGVDRITHIIEDLDTITQLESGRLELDKRKINIVDLAKEVMDSLEMKAKDKGIVLNFNKEYEKPIYVNCDKNRIAQVLTNLLVNSVNYGKEGGKTSIRFFDMDENILIEVADNGPGIAKQHLNRIFERFYRVDKSRARNQGGSGLGLAIVKHIIEAHHQTVNVRSTEGVGTTFAFTLERAK